VTDKQDNHVILKLEKTGESEEYLMSAPPLIIGNLIAGERYIEP